MDIQSSNLNTLPSEIIVKIASLLPTSSLINLFMTCKDTQAAIKSNGELTLAALKSKGLTKRVEEENIKETAFTVINIDSDLSAKASQFIAQVQEFVLRNKTLVAQLTATGACEVGIIPLFSKKSSNWRLKCSLLIGGTATRFFENRIRMNVDCKQLISMRTYSETVLRHNSSKGSLETEAYGDEKITTLANILFQTLKQFIEPNE